MRTMSLTVCRFSSPQRSRGFDEEIAQGLDGLSLRRTDQDMRSSRLSRILQNLHAILDGPQRLITPNLLWNGKTGCR